MVRDLPFNKKENKNSDPTLGDKKRIHLFSKYVSALYAPGTGQTLHWGSSKQQSRQIPFSDEVHILEEEAKNV